MEHGVRGGSVEGRNALPLVDRCLYARSWAGLERRRRSAYFGQAEARPGGPEGVVLTMAASSLVMRWIYGPIEME